MIKNIEVDIAPVRRDPVQPQVVGNLSKAAPLTELIAEIESGEGERDFSSASFRAATLVRSMRKDAAFSQRDLATRIGVTQARISEIEAGLGKHGPSWDVMERIAGVCGREIGLIPKAGVEIAVADPSTRRTDVGR